MILRVTFYQADRNGRLDESAPIGSVDMPADGPDAAPVLQTVPPGALWVGTQLLARPRTFHDVPLIGLDEIQSDR